MSIDSFSITIPGGPRILCGRITARGDAAEPRRGFLVVPGFWGDWRRPGYAGLMKALSEHGTVLAANLRGHGGCSGWFSFGRNEPGDMGPLYDHLLDQGVRRITSLGFSLGGWALAEHLSASADHRSITGHLLLAGVPSRMPWVLPRPWIPGLWTQLRKGGRGWVRPDPLSLLPGRDLRPAVEKLGDLPVTVLHCERDWMVHHRHGERLYGRVRGPKRWVLIPDRRGLHVEMVCLCHGDKVLEAALHPPRRRG